MYACDFEYDGQYLSDFGFVICDFGGTSGYDTFNVGSVITFNTVARQSGKIYGLTGTQYDECVTATFNICKDPEQYDDLIITNDECRDIVRWLNRREFLPFQLVNGGEDDSESCWYDASFNVNKLMMAKDVYGLELTMESNRPFGYGQEVTYSWNIVDYTKTYLLSDISDEIGYVYPEVSITINESGDFTLYNSMENCTTYIANCTAGEVITLSGDSLIITTSLASHNIYNDFNYEFFRIGNTLNDRNNYITVSLPCKLVISYTPVIKDSPV